MKTTRVETASLGLDLTPEAGKPKPVAKKPKARKTKPANALSVATKHTQAKAVKKPNQKLNRAAIAKVVRKHMPEVQNCYEMGLLQDPRLSGQVVLEWTIAPDGRVQHINTVRNSMGSPTVAMCIAAELRNWSFPEPDRGSLTVSYPFVFSPTSF